METEFTPITSLIGGMLIGASAVLLMLANGKIAGISGIVSRFLSFKFNDSDFKLSIAFIIGLLLAAPLYLGFTGGLPEQVMTSNAILLIVAGLLVGFGATMGSGCTSGHGVCGISRGSKRSIAATLVFMATGILTVYILRHTELITNLVGGL
ncbi:MAG: YeeE/YedE family protein [Nitratireductor sp.]